MEKGKRFVSHHLDKNDYSRSNESPRSDSPSFPPFTTSRTTFAAWRGSVDRRAKSIFSKGLASLFGFCWAGEGTVGRKEERKKGKEGRNEERKDGQVYRSCRVGRGGEGSDGKRNARSDDSCGRPPVTRSARIFLDKIFLTRSSAQTRVRAKGGARSSFFRFSRTKKNTSRLLSRKTLVFRETRIPIETSLFSSSLFDALFFIFIRQIGRDLFAFASVCIVTRCTREASRVIFNLENS